ncbi:hypothetical protein [Streptomyces sp. NBC_01198]|nr:hypothetical protein OG702_17015 [Streptomyces sp. NBC_01198]
MRALETIGVSLAVIAFTVATLLFMMGGLKYQHIEEHQDGKPDSG